MNTPSFWDNFIFVSGYEKLNTWRAKVEGFGSYFNLMGFWEEIGIGILDICV